MKIGLLGDTHANHRWIALAAHRFHDLGITTVIQVGDLGVFSSARASKDWNNTDRLLGELGITLLVAPGNHEDYDYIDAMQPGEDGWLEYRVNILLAPRGLRTTMGGREFVWLGGAGSVDRTIREADREHGGQRWWWPGEAVTDEDVANTVSGGHAHVMVAHDAPVGVPEIDVPLLKTAHLWDADDLAYAQACREKFTEAVAGVEPDLLLHGHYHFPVAGRWTNGDSSHESKIFGLGMDEDFRSSLGMLDTENLRVSHVDMVNRASGGRCGPERYWSADVS